MNFYVTFFEKFVSIIPESWIAENKTCVYWPKGKINKKKMFTMEPEDSWEKKTIRKLLGPFDNMKLAQEVEKACENASTGDDSETIIQTVTDCSTKRKRKKPNRYIDSDENGGDDDSEDETSDSLDGSKMKKLSEDPPNIFGSPCKTPTHDENPQLNSDSDLTDEQSRNTKFSNEIINNVMEEKNKSNFEKTVFETENTDPLQDYEDDLTTNEVPNNVNDTSKEEDFLVPNDEQSSNHNLSKGLEKKEPKKPVIRIRSNEILENPIPTINKNGNLIRTNVGKAAMNKPANVKSGNTNESNSKTKQGDGKNLPKKPLTFKMLQEIHEAKKLRERILKNENVGEPSSSREQKKPISQVPNENISPNRNLELPQISNDCGLVTEKTFKACHKQVMNKLNLIILSKESIKDDDIEEIDIAALLPIKSTEALDYFNEELQTSPEFKKAFINFIKGIGGKKEGDRVRNAMRQLITDEFIIRGGYTWSGQKKTTIMKDMEVIKIVLHVISKSSASYTIASCSEYLKNYLQHASDRIKAAEKRK